MSQGYGFREAAIMGGVNYRTTRRWRSSLWSNTKRDPETGGRKTIVRTFRGHGSFRYLSNDDRIWIADLRLAGWSVRRIAAEMRREFPDRPETRVVHETIYLALYIQGRGELRRELHKALRTGRAR